MKNLIISAVFISVLTISNLFAFDGGHDSLVYDGGNEIKVIQSFAGDCPVKVLYASGQNNGISRVRKLVTDCSGKVIDTLYERTPGVLKKDDNVVLGEEVSTGADGVVELELWDGATMRMAPNTSIKITEDFCDHRSIFEKYGNIWTKVKKIIGGGKFEVSTGGAVIGNRGTEYSIEVINEKTITRVYEHSVEVTKTGASNEQGINDASKQMEKLNEDYKNGKITQDEYMKKLQEFSNVLQSSQENTNKMTIVEAGYMLTVSDVVGTTETIPSSDVKWFEDANFYRK